MSSKDHDTQNGKYPGLSLKFASSQSTIEGEILENLRLLVARVQRTGEFPRKLAVTSALSGEGVTSVCLGLGAVLAHDYQVKVCIADLNWYSPSELITDPTQGGIIDVLENDLPINQALVSTGVKSMQLLPAGTLDLSIRPVMARSAKLIDLLDKLAGMFDYVIMDVPALLSSSDAVHLANPADACILVVQQGVTPLPVIKKSLDEISHLQILGVVLNQVQHASPRFLMRLFES